MMSYDGNVTSHIERIQEQKEYTDGLKLLLQQRDHARAMVGTLLGLLHRFPTAVSDYELPHSPAPGDGWDPLAEEDE